MNLRSVLALTVDRVVTPIESMHRTISSRWFRAVGPIAAPVRITHDTVAAIVYRAIRAGSATVGWGLDATEPRATTSDSVQAWINGLWGDDLGRHRRTLELGMTVRDASGHPILPEAAGSCVHTPSGHIAFFVHGLVETERRWLGNEAGPGLARVIEDRCSVSPILIRYNTGLPTATNGARLAEIVQRVVDGWPLPVHSISLVGHSMGGLVATNACGAAATSDMAWVDEVANVITIGTPHGGAPLEKLTAVASWGLNVTATTRPLAAFLDRRSQGIKGLRAGTVAASRPTQVRLAHLRHHFIGGVLTKDPSHPLGVMVGDLMVRPNSATASAPIEASNTVILGGVHHFRLLDEPAVADHVVKWLNLSRRPEIASDHLV